MSLFSIIDLAYVVRTVRMIEKHFRFVRCYTAK